MVLLDPYEILLYSNVEPPPKMYDFIIHRKIEWVVMNFYILKDLGLDKLLEAIREKFEIIVTTARFKECAFLVLNMIYPKGVNSHQLYWDSCKEMQRYFYENFVWVGEGFERVVIIDDNLNAYVF